LGSTTLHFYVAHPERPKKVLLLRGDAEALEELGVEALFELLFKRIGFRLRLGAVMPTIGERLGRVNHALAFLAPPMNHQLVIVGESDFIDAGRCLPALATKRDVSIAHFQNRYLT
jgi:hypothetical protein